VDIWSTGVARDHRGHGLGLRLKAAASLWMRALDPAARLVGTANHEGNSAMLRINRALGYLPAESWYTYEFPVIR
jgi:GNAT superfamily N-acetyltransferase